MNRNRSTWALITQLEKAGLSSVEAFATADRWQVDNPEVFKDGYSSDEIEALAQALLAQREA